jgi:hypothetical protein
VYHEKFWTVTGLLLVVQMPAGALFYESVPGDVREFVMRLLHHALPFATDTAQDAEVLVINT